ncbi:MAG TPA: hypothetical protein VIP75_07795, partial [Acidothermales bacterium]
PSWRTAALRPPSACSSSSWASRWFSWWCSPSPHWPSPDRRTLACRSLRDSASPDYGSGASVLGVGLVLVLGLGLIAIGLLFMLWQRSRDPAFFRGETLVKDTPALVVED